jgi:uncharacterized protein (DUF433 family)
MPDLTHNQPMSSKNLIPFIEVHPEVQGGAAVFRGTRVPIQSLFDHLEAGESIEDFLEGFRTVKRDQVIGLLEVLREETLAAVG